MQKTFFSLLATVAGGVVYRLTKSKPTLVSAKRVLSAPGSIVPLSKSKQDVVLRRYLMYFMLPLWFVPGLLDYLWHKRTKIETTSGTEESIIHALMMTEVGLPILAGLLLEINAGVLALMLAAFGIHSLTAIWDVAFAVKRRLVMPREQHTHSFLEMLPFCAVSFAVCLHWEQFLALFGQGDEPAEFLLRWKEEPLPKGYVVAILALIGVLIALPYGEELLRCWQAQQKGLIGTDTPECARELFHEATAFGLEGKTA